MSVTKGQIGENDVKMFEIGIAVKLLEPRIVDRIADLLDFQCRFSVHIAVRLEKFIEPALDVKVIELSRKEPYPLRYPSEIQFVQR